EIPTQTEVDGQLASKLEVVVTVNTIIVFAVVRKGDVREVDLVWASEETNCTAIGSGSRDQQEIRDAGVSIGIVGDVRVIAVVIERSEERRVGKECRVRR